MLIQHIFYKITISYTISVVTLIIGPEILMAPSASSLFILINHKRESQANIPPNSNMDNVLLLHCTTSILISPPDYHFTIYLIIAQTTINFLMIISNKLAIPIIFDYNKNNLFHNVITGSVL